MSDIEFKEKVDEMFKEYENHSIYNSLSHPNDKRIDDNLILRFGFSLFGLIDGKNKISLYRSQSFEDDYEKYYDEIIIFKELILPKYL